MKRRRALSPRNNFEARLWPRLREMRERGWHFRRAAPFKTFTLAFVEHEARLVIDLLDGEPGQRKSLDHAVRDRLLSERGYVILRLWRAEAERDLHGALHKIREVLETPSADS
jgi:very-short-patch-repair endonuclease